MSHRTIILIMGPTASGKTKLAFHLAHQINGALINGDSMQLYEHLSIITARPSVSERTPFSHIPYALDGVLGGSDQSTVGWWLDQAKTWIQTAWDDNRIPIVVGGTGLYLKSIIEGLAPIPDIPDPIKEQVRALSSKPFEELYALIAPQAPFLEPYQDPQRLLRAYEVFLATQKPMSYFKDQQKPPFDARILVLTLQPERAHLNQRINQRFLDMMNHGVLDEVAQFHEGQKRQPLPSHHPLLKCTGLSPLRQYLEGRHSLDDAIVLAQQHTRQYAKRQYTWMKGQMRANVVCDLLTQDLQDCVDACVRIMG